MTWPFTWISNQAGFVHPMTTGDGSVPEDPFGR